MKSTFDKDLPRIKKPFGIGKTNFIFYLALCNPQVVLTYKSFINTIKVICPKISKLLKSSKCFV